MGLHERDGGTLYNATALLGADGARHRRRKLVPTHGERLVWGMGDGSTLESWPRPYGALGSLICWEHWMPLARAAIHARGEAIHIAQWPEVSELHALASRTYAFEGQCVVVAAGGVLTRDHVLAGYDGAGGDRTGRAFLEQLPAGLLKAGGSAVIGPDTQVLHGPFGPEHALVTVAIDLAALTAPQPRLDVTGHYARPDVLQLRVDTTARSGVIFGGGVDGR